MTRKKIHANKAQFFILSKEILITSTKLMMNRGYNEPAIELSVLNTPD
jgi:hypothetical protein